MSGPAAGRETRRRETRGWPGVMRHAGTTNLDNKPLSDAIGADEISGWYVRIQCSSALSEGGSMDLGMENQAAGM